MLDCLKIQRSSETILKPHPLRTGSWYGEVEELKEVWRGVVSSRDQAIGSWGLDCSQPVVATRNGQVNWERSRSNKGIRS